MSPPAPIISIDIEAIENDTYILRAEKELAIRGLLEAQVFSYLKSPQGPYKIKLAVEEGHLVFHFRDAHNDPLPLLAVSLRPYRKLIDDYFLMVESFEQTRLHSPYKLEAVDMGRRGVHNEAAALLKERLKDKIEMDFETARRFFTLICVLHLNNRRMLVS